MIGHAGNISSRSHFGVTVEDLSAALTSIGDIFGHKYLSLETGYDPANTPAIGYAG